MKYGKNQVMSIFKLRSDKWVSVFYQWIKYGQSLDVYEIKP